MNFIPGQEQQDAGDDQDLNAALEQGETAFVTESARKQVNTSTLGLVGLLALCAGGTYFMYLRGGPQAASAADTATAQTITSFLADGEKHVKLMKEMLKDTDKVVQRFRQSTSLTQIPAERLRTNPFQMEVAAPVVATDDGASSRRRREEERAAAAEAVKALKLQSILYGARRAALLNNQLVQEGMTVEGFVVEQITADNVVVRQGIYRFALKMQQ